MLPFVAKAVVMNAAVIVVPTPEVAGLATFFDTRPHCCGNCCLALATAVAVRLPVFDADVHTVWVVATTQAAAVVVRVMVAVVAAIEVFSIAVLLAADAGVVFPETEEALPASHHSLPTLPSPCQF